MFILYDLYFDGIDDVDNDEHVDNFDGGLGDKGRYLFRSINFQCIYYFTRSIS